MLTYFEFNDLAVFEKPIVMYLAGYSADRLPIDFVTDSKLTKTQTLQLCIYYFLNPDSNNFVFNIPIKSLAELISCSSRTIKVNNKSLLENRFISYTENKNNTISLKLHIKEALIDQESLLLRKNLLLRILELENINSIRITFRFIIRLHENNKLYNKGKIFYSYNDIQRFLPSNINHPKIINQLVLNTSNIFDVEISNNGIIISYK